MVHDPSGYNPVSTPWFHVDNLVKCLTTVGSSTSGNLVGSVLRKDAGMSSRRQGAKGPGKL
jgi:hypothetical protein